MFIPECSFWNIDVLTSFISKNNDDGGGKGNENFKKAILRSVSHPAIESFVNDGLQIN